MPMFVCRWEQALFWVCGCPQTHFPLVLWGSPCLPWPWIFLVLHWVHEGESSVVPLLLSSFGFSILGAVAMFISWSLSLSAQPTDMWGPFSLCYDPKALKEASWGVPGFPSFLSYLLRHCTLLPDDQHLESRLLCILFLFVLCWRRVNQSFYSFLIGSESLPL